VSALPLEVNAVLAVVLLLSVGRAFLGVPARRRHERLARTLVALAILLYVLAAAELAHQREGLAALFVIAGVEALCVAAWVTRRREDDDGGDDGEGPEDDRPDWRPPGAGGRDLVDWDAFDQARDTWRPFEPAS
jgi:hypothetical protein